MSLKRKTSHPQIPPENILNLRKGIPSLSKISKKKESSSDILSKPLKKRKHKTKKIDLVSFLVEKEKKKKQRKRMLILAGILFILTIPFLIQNFNRSQGVVLGSSTQGIVHLKEAIKTSQNLDLISAHQDFIKAKINFERAVENIPLPLKFVAFIDGVLPFSSKKISSYYYLLKTAHKISKVGENITEILEPLERREKFSSFREFFLVFQNLPSKLPSIQEDLEDIQKFLERIDENNLPSEYRYSFTQLKDSLPVFRTALSRSQEVLPPLITLLGRDATKRYLLLFQNNAELRATGGFLGSLALMDIREGEILNLEIPGGGVYDIAGQFSEKIIAPRPLWLVNPHWNLQDANWFADFPLSAQKIIWFWEKAGGPTVDGVIALTPEVIEGLLKVTGPLQVEGFSEEITDQNFRRLAQEEADKKYDENPKPKEFIGRIATILLEKIFSSGKIKDWFKIAQTLTQALEKRYILIYVSDPDLEEKIINLGWGGEIKKSEGDYLMVVVSNIGGGKTDLKIKQIVDVISEVSSDGSIINTVKLTRIHTGRAEDKFEGVKNIAFVRFYVPRGSQFLSAEGSGGADLTKMIYPDKEAKEDEYLIQNEGKAFIEENTQIRITQEKDKTVFGGWMGVEAGQKQEVVLKYKLPFEIDQKSIQKYYLYLQKQAGLKPYFISWHLILPDNIKLNWYPHLPEFEVEKNTLIFKSELIQDKNIQLLLEKN